MQQQIQYNNDLPPLGPAWLYNEVVRLQSVPCRSWQGDPVVCMLNTDDNQYWLGYRSDGLMYNIERHPEQWMCSIGSAFDNKSLIQNEQTFDSKNLLCNEQEMGACYGPLYNTERCPEQLDVCSIDSSIGKKTLLQIEQEKEGSYSSIHNAERLSEEFILQLDDISIRSSVRLRKLIETKQEKRTSSDLPPWYQNPCSFFYSSNRPVNPFNFFYKSNKQEMEMFQHLQTTENGLTSQKTEQLELFCGFCRNNGAPVKAYTNHSLRNHQGKLTCMVLRNYVCPKCGATGDDAHTINYCPFKYEPEGPLVTKLKSTKRNATSVRPRVAPNKDMLFYEVSE